MNSFIGRLKQARLALPGVAAESVLTLLVASLLGII
jgi:hypothetical protein